jgi:hypothetical protein
MSFGRDVSVLRYPVTERKEILDQRFLLLF